MSTGLARKSAHIPKKRSRRISGLGTRERESSSSVPESQATVLVVDDDPSVLRALSRQISACGFQVEAFTAPSQILETDIPKKNACMVVDIDLPEMNGIEMCEVLKRSGRNLPTILITGRTDERTRKMAERADVIAVLFKPFDEKPLLEAISRALALSKQADFDI